MNPTPFCRTGLVVFLLAAAGCNSGPSAEAILPSSDPLAAQNPLQGLPDPGGLTELSDPDGSDGDPACDVLDLGEEGAYLAQGIEISDERTWCTAAVHASAGAQGSTVRISLTEWGGVAPAAIEVRDLLDNTMLLSGALEGGDSIEVELERSGEVLLHLTPTDLEEQDNSYALKVECIALCAEYTRHPIVLVHGMAGAEDYLDLMDYWFGIPEVLQGEGYSVFFPAVDGLAPPQTRAPQWSEHLDSLQLLGQGRRFNLIGHSQGGIDARYLVGGLGEGGRVASITTVGSPHYGNLMADIVAGAVFVDPMFNALVDQAASQITELLGMGEAELVEETAALTSSAMEEFNATIPDDPRTAYYSWAGRSCAPLQFACLQQTGGEIISPMLHASYRLIDAIKGPNDGLVTVVDAQWGDFLGELPADHLDEVGQLAGITDVFDHRGFYLQEARRLAGEGF